MQIHVNKLPPPQPDNTMVGVDVEMWGMKQRQLHRPTSGRFACLTISTDAENVYFLDTEELVDIFLGRIDNCIWCIHNSSFDITQLRRYSKIPPRKRLWDTLLMERIMWNGLYSGFALNDLVRRYLNEKRDKTLQKSFSKDTGEPMTNEQVHYAALDAIDHLQVAKAQKPHITKKYFNLYQNVDLAAQWAILDFAGFRIDVDAWLALADYHTNKQLEIDEELEFNPRSKGSTGQVAQYCKDTFGIELKSVAEKYVRKMMVTHKDNTEFVELMQNVLDSNKFSKKASTYGEKFIQNYAEYTEDGLAYIYANFDPSRAKTGRMSSSNPNCQNIPARDTNAFRECFIASPGHKLVIADFSSQEPRITAYITKDPKLISFFEAGGDPYILMGKEFYGKEITKGSDERFMMKTLFLALVYGFTEYGMRREYGMTLEEGKEFLARARKIFPVAYNVMEEIGDEKRCIINLLGRPIWLNPYQNEHDVASLARNAGIQSVAAEQMKMVLTRLHKEQCEKYGKCFVVAPVHDEVVLDVPDEFVPEVKKQVERIMVEVAEEVCPGVPFKADVVVADNWGAKG